MRRTDMKTGVEYATQRKRNYDIRAGRVLVCDDDWVDAVRFGEASWFASTGEKLRVGGGRSYRRELSPGPEPGSVWVAVRVAGTDEWKPREIRSATVIEPYAEWEANRDAHKIAVAEKKAAIARRNDEKEQRLVALLVRLNALGGVGSMFEIEHSWRTGYPIAKTVDPAVPTARANVSEKWLTELADRLEAREQG